MAVLGEAQIDSGVTPCSHAHSKVSSVFSGMRDTGAAMRLNVKRGRFFGGTRIAAASKYAMTRRQYRNRRIGHLSIASPVLYGAQTIAPNENRV